VSGEGVPARPPDAPWDLRGPRERDYFARYGDGLVVVVPAQGGGPPRGGRPVLPTGGAWVHVGAGGAITAAIGKVEVGQGTRTALALLVAEELRAALADVTVEMGDTDVTPWDMGTFGSMSMPVAGPALRRAAAAARGLLVAKAATELGVAAADLHAEGGRVLGPGGRAVGYAELVRGLRAVELAPPDAALTPATAWTTAGRPTPSHGAVDAVTGARRYGSDLRLPDMRHGALCPAPAVGATPRAVDAAAARAMPGVTVIHDDALVAVAAPTALAARVAAAAVRIEWDLREAPAETETAAYLRAHPTEGEGFWGALHHEVGDVAGALADAPVTLAATYTAAYIAHVPLECHVALAAWQGDDLTVWVGTQTPFLVRGELAGALGLAPARVRVIVPPTGSGFGGKHGGDVALAAARLARASGHPVRLAFSRQEELTRAYLRPMAVIDVRAGARADGTLTAWAFHNLNSGSAAVMTPYTVEHQRIDYQPAASPLAQGSYRALAATANHFARESMMDELAARVGVDPLEYRVRHLADDRLVAVLRAACERAGWAARKPAPGSGWGLAGGVEKGGRVATVAEVRAGGALEVVRLTCAFECGAVVNPDNLENQIEGALVMGLGGALFEAVHHDHGRITTDRLEAYRVPRFGDVPAIDVVLVPRPDQPPAGGGETPIVAVAPAIASAVFAATGVRLRALPLVPDGVVPGA
jgi:CO/xanthine dehydrogenase Mo-binding subunit